MHWNERGEREPDDVGDVSYDVILNTERTDEHHCHEKHAVVMEWVPTIEDARALAYMALRWEVDLPRPEGEKHCSRCGIYDNSIPTGDYEPDRIGEVVIWYDGTARYYDKENRKYVLNRDGSLGERER